MAAPIASPFGTPTEIAEHLRTSEEALAQQRWKGTGPGYIKDGRRVLYRWSDIDAYIEANTTAPGE